MKNSTSMKNKTAAFDTKSKISTGLICALLAALVLAAPSKAKADYDFSLTIGSGTMAGYVQSAISSYLATATWDSGTPSVKSARKNDTTLRMTVTGVSYKLGTAQIPLAIYFDLVFGCPYTAGEQLISIANLAVKPGVSISASTLLQIINEVNTMLKAKTQTIVNKMSSLMSTIQGAVNEAQHNLCPHYQMKTDGSFYCWIYLSNCVDEVRYSTQCPAYAIGGTGASYRCDNGRWITATASTCVYPPETDPEVPPGGIQP